MRLRLSASGRTAQQPKSYCTKLPCSKAQARYLSQNIGIVTNCKTTHAKENYYSTGPGSFAHAACVHRPAHNVYMCICVYVYMCMCVYVYMCTCIYNIHLEGYDPGLGWGSGGRAGGGVLASQGFLNPGVKPLQLLNPKALRVYSPETLWP